MPDAIKLQHGTSEGDSALTLEVAALHGVNPSAAEFLEELHIRTVFDLATAQPFCAAHDLIRVHRDPAAVEKEVGLLSSSLVQKTVTIERLPSAALDVLQGMTTGVANGFESVLGINTVGELARWPPFLAARRLAGIEDDELDPYVDPGVPQELVPRLGAAATETRFYDRFVLDDGGEAASKDQVDLAETGLRLSASDSESEEPTALASPKVGAHLTFRQSWTPQALGFGNVLHTVALAPGESTNIAVTDWSRRQTSRFGEKLDEQDSLDSRQQRARSIQEVSEGVASEQLTGETSSETAAQSATTAESGFNALSGGSQENASSESVQTVSATASSGQRNMASAMSQSINDRTAQHANSARTRRATVVRESLQQENEKIVTRNLTNYNHMHALSVEYLEVVQVFRVSVTLSGLERCLLIPYAPIRAWNDEILVRYHQQLMRAALTPAVARQLAYPIDRLRLSGDFQARESGRRPKSRFAAGAVLVGVSLREDGLSGSGRSSQAPEISFQVVRSEEESSPVRHDFLGSTLPLAGIAEINAILTRTAAAPQDRSGPFVATLQIRERRGRPPVDVDVSFSFTAAQGQTATVVRVHRETYPPTLLKHIRENSQHYNARIWQTLGESGYTKLLESYAIGGAPLLSLVDAKPIGITGSHLIFRFPESKEPSRNLTLGELQSRWEELKGSILGPTLAPSEGDEADEPNHPWAGYPEPTVSKEYISMPTGGTFVEAVLGRANSAERIDLTRWWDWQESPIPLSAPEIAAVESGTKARVMDLTPGQMHDALVKIMDPEAIPDPTSLSGILSALNNSEMFEDLSGLSESIEAAKSALQSTSALADATGEQSSQNLANGLKMTSEAIQKMVDVVGKFASTMVSAGLSEMGGAEGLLGAVSNEVTGSTESEGE